MTNTEPGWCDPEQCTAHERIPDRPSTYFAHRSRPRLVGPGDSEVAVQLVQPAGDDRPRLAVGVKSGPSGGLSVRLVLDDAVRLGDFIADLTRAGSGR